MTQKTHLSHEERAFLAALLQSRIEAMERERVSQLHGLSQAEAARQTLLQDADDATQLSGSHEVEGSLSDIDSAEFEALESASQRIHGDGYGLCIDCHAPIPFERLRLEPQALRCVACENRHDLKASA